MLQHILVTMEVSRISLAYGLRCKIMLTKATFAQ